MIVPELQHEISRLEHVQHSYAMAERFMSEISQKVIVTTLGGSGAGKNTIMEAAAVLDPDFSLVNTLTTRQPAPRDVPGTVTYYNTERNQRELIRMIDAGEVAQFTLFPRTNDIYGTLPGDYETQFCMKDVLVNGLDDFRRMPFKRVVALSIVSEPHEYMRRFNERWTADDPDRKKRLQQTIESNVFSLRQHNSHAPDHFWLPNTSEPEIAARALIGIARGEITHVPDASELAKGIIELAELELAA